MSKSLLAITAAVFFGLTGLVQAQSTGDIAGTYLVPKGPSVVEIVHEGQGYRVKQISSTSAKEQMNNGKVRAEIPDAAAQPLIGIVNDFDSGKQYRATWEVTDGGATLTMKVKVAFLTSSYVWKKQSGPK